MEGNRFHVELNVGERSTYIRDANTVTEWPFNLTNSNFYLHYIFFYFWRDSPPVDPGIIHEVCFSRSHLMTTTVGRTPLDE